jgi:GNAT superfamily N-acetyltransferase
MDHAQFQIRAMTSADSAAVAELCRQLGYSPEQQDVQRSIELIENHPDHFLRVAINQSGQTIAWIHGCAETPIEAPPYVRVSSLVVDAAHRGNGIGKRLMIEVEDWARGKGIRLVSLRSQTYREEAHRFYEHIGYKKTKTSFRFERRLD